MPTNSADVVQIAHSIGQIAHQMTSDVSLLGTSARTELIQHAEKLAIAAREPEENLYFQATQVRPWCRYEVVTTLRN